MNAAETSEPILNDAGAMPSETIEPKVIVFDIQPEIDPVLGRELSRSEDWAAMACADRNDLDERARLTRVHQLWLDAEECLEHARRHENPNEVSRQYRAALRNIKSMLTVIGALDRRRRGFVQEIVVDYGGQSAGSMESTAENPKLAQSDWWIDRFVQSVLDEIDDLAARCRDKAEWLSCVPPERLLRNAVGCRPGPDRRQWETKFRGMAGHLMGQYVKLTDSLGSRHKPRLQIIRVKYLGERPGKKSSKPKSSEMSAVKSDQAEAI
jgi:hypothetical protein